MEDYIFDKEKRISLLKARNNGVTFSKADQFFPKNVRYQSHKLPFGFYASNRFNSFYPYDCCGIKEKSGLLKSDYPFNGTPDLLEQRGLGNYFLDLKIVSEKLMFIIIDILLIIVDNIFLINILLYKEIILNI